MHTEGGDPAQVTENIRNEFKEKIEFYGITACRKCKKEAHEEVYRLSSKNGKNYVFIKDFYQLSAYLDQVTDVKIDFARCGQAGDVGSIKKQAQLARVIGGDDATENAWPWQGLITWKRSSVEKIFEKLNVLGGGSLLNNQWFLTAAHLFHNKDGEEKWFEKFVVSLGIFRIPKNHTKLMKSVQMFIPGNIILHEDYNEDTMEYDIALVKLGRSLQVLKRKIVEVDAARGVNYTYYIRPVCLPCTGTCLKEDQIRDGGGSLLVRPNMNAEEKCRAEESILLENSAKVVVTGFGHQNISKYIYGIPENVLNLGRNLQQALLRIKDPESCKINLKEINGKLGNAKMGIAENGEYSENIICLESGIKNKIIDSCQGDSGGPVVREVLDKVKKSCWVQIGIVSWGYGCGLRYPAYYTNVARFIPWIETHIPDIRTERDNPVNNE